MKRVLATLLLMLLSDVAFSAEPVAVKPPQQKILSTPQGRYIFGQVSEFRRDQYLLDTQTGRLWQIVSGDNERAKLEPVPFIQILGDEAYMPDPDDEVQNLRKLVRRKTFEELQKKEAEGQGAPEVTKEGTGLYDRLKKKAAEDQGAAPEAETSKK